LKVKAKALGHESSLPFYDLFAPMGRLTKQYSYEEGRSFVLENFKTFSDKLAAVAEKAIEEKWIDVEPGKGKVSGAFCASQHSIGEFRILLNYTGNLGDVTTMAHELGHGYHAICIGEEKMLNTHSLQDATQVICDIYSRYLFESNLFETRKNHPLSVSELKSLMIEAQKSAYGDGLDHDTLHPYMWLIKPHYYSAALNFYNFPYAFGLLFAKGLYAKYLDSPEFFKSKYDDLLAASGKMSIVDVCKIMEVDVESVDFWNDSLSILEKDIETFITLVQEG
jgi:oligoendopeptidase F